MILIVSKDADSKDTVEIEIGPISMYYYLRKGQTIDIAGNILIVRDIISN